MADDRAQGLMVGLAVGNLLGISTEGWSRSWIARAFPGGMEDIVARPGFPDDDDLAQAIIIAEAATGGGGLDIDDLGRRFWHWAEVNGAGMGRLTGAVLSLYGGDYPQRLGRERETGKPREPDGLPIIEASRKGWRGDRAGNGALMRTAPLSIRWRDSRDRLVYESVLSAVPTHWDVRCGWSCAIANLVTAAALTGTILDSDMLMREAEAGMAASLPRLEAYGYDTRAPKSVVDAVDEASVSTLDDLRFDGHDMGYTLLSLQAALISCWGRRISNRVCGRWSRRAVIPTPTAPLPVPCLAPVSALRAFPNAGVDGRPNSGPGASGWRTAPTVWWPPGKGRR